MTLISVQERYIYCLDRLLLFKWIHFCIKTRIYVTYSIGVLTYYHILPIDPSNRNAFLSGTAHEHKSHVVSPSDTTVSSKKSGLGGGGTNLPFHSPVSLASNARGDPNRSSSKFIQNSKLVSTDSKSLATKFEPSENIVLAINLEK